MPESKSYYRVFWFGSGPLEDKRLAHAQVAPNGEFYIDIPTKSGMFDLSDANQLCIARDVIRLLKFWNVKGRYERIVEEVTEEVKEEISEEAEVIEES